MKIIVYPDRIDFHSGNPTVQVNVAKIIGFDPVEGFIRAGQCVWFVPALGRHQCRLKPGIYQVRTEEGADFLLLLPQRIELSVAVARELLQSPAGLPSPAPVPEHLARVMSAIILSGASWAVAAQAVGLAANGQMPTDPLSGSKDCENDGA